MVKIWLPVFGGIMILGLLWSVPVGLWPIHERRIYIALMKQRLKANLPACGRALFILLKIGATLNVVEMILLLKELLQEEALSLTLALGSNKMDMFTKVFECNTEDDTKRLATCFGKIAKRGDIFALYGTLGAGKSIFARYFIQSLTDATEVPSPTFTLVQTYESDNFEIYHYDMYRLKIPEEAYELGIEESFYSGVNLIEWPEKIGYLLPKDIWQVTIQVINNTRCFEFSVNNEEKRQRLEKIDYA